MLDITGFTLKGTTMADKTINDLHLLLVEQQGDTKLVLSKLEAIDKWRDQHEKDDKVIHKDLHDRISSVKRCGGAIAIVGVMIGYLGTKMGLK